MEPGGFPEFGRLERLRDHEQMEESSGRLRRLAGPRTVHPQRAGAAIRAGNLAGGSVARFPNIEREALVLHYRQGCSLAEISVSLDRSTIAVAGLLKRGPKHLPEQLDA